MQVVLVRHGATDWNLEGRCQGSSDRDLCELGVRQAEQISALFSQEKLHAIYSSNLRRARRTADVISRPHDLPVLVESLAPGGILIYETFMAGNERFGKPSNPEFLLRPGELLEAFRTLRIVAFEQGRLFEPKPAMIQRLCAIGAAGG